MSRPSPRWAILLLVWFSCAWFGSWEGNPNNATRLFAAVSLVEDGDATIDEFAPLTIDKATFDGHFYLDKAPGMTILALPAVALADALSGETAATVRADGGDPALWRFLQLRQWLATASGPALLTAIAAALLFDMGVVLTGSARAALFGSLAFGLGTPVWGWSTTLFGHAPVAALYVIAAWATWRGAHEGRAGFALLAGAALGWAVVVEYQAVLAGVVLALWSVWRAWHGAARWRWIGAATLGGVIALAPLAVYNLVAFGTVFRLGYQGVVGFEGMDQGLFGLTRPSPTVLAEILFGPRRGLLWVAPVMVLAPFGFVAMWRRERERDLALAAAGAALVVLLVNAAYVYWDGGNSTGPRHAVPALGLLGIALAPAWASLAPGWRRETALWLLVAAMLFNVAIAAAEIMAPPELGFPLKQAVWDLRLSQGQVRTVANSLLGYSHRFGMTAYFIVAGAALAWLLRRTGQADRATDAASREG